MVKNTTSVAHIHFCVCMRVQKGKKRDRTECRSVHIVTTVRGHKKTKKGETKKGIVTTHILHKEAKTEGEKKNEH